MEKCEYRSYDPRIRAKYAAEKLAIQKALPGGVEIEHVGSTAVPGLGGKGILDIAVYTPEQKSKDFIQRLERIAYKYKPDHPGDEDRKFLQKIVDPEDTNQRIHLHLALSRDFFNSYLAFRDYLIANPLIMKRYDEIKKNAALVAKGNGGEYYKLKRDFLTEFSQLALREYENKV